MNIDIIICHYGNVTEKKLFFTVLLGNFFFYVCTVCTLFLFSFTVLPENETQSALPNEYHIEEYMSKLQSAQHSKQTVIVPKLKLDVWDFSVLQFFFNAISSSTGQVPSSLGMDTGLTGVRSNFEIKSSFGVFYCGYVSVQ